MKAWWLVSVASVALMLAALVLDGSMPPALRAVLAALVVLWAAALVVLWAAALVYAVARRW